MKNEEGFLPVFVYGTLRRGERNHWNYLDRGRTCLEIPAVLDDYTMYNVGRGGFPAILPQKGGKVIGEVVWLKESEEEAVLASLDYLEGFNPKKPEGSMYVRKEELVNLTSGGFAKCWVYVWNRGRAYLGDSIESGDWKKRPRETPAIW